jgi:hypothetical protein
MADMIVLTGIAAAIFVVLISVAYLVARCFQNKRTRKRIMIGTIVVYSLACVAYFGFLGFILSGDLNR